MPLSLNKIKLLKSLQQKKFRQKYNFFIAEGPKIAIEALSSTTTEIVEIFATETWVAEHNALLSHYQSIVTVVSEKELKKVSTLKTPNLVLILAKIPDLTVNHSLIEDGAHIFCDEIKDPGNLGTIIRIADWYGMTGISLGEGCVDPYNPKTVQASMGSILRMPIGFKASDQVAEYINSFDQSYAAVMDGDPLYDMQFSSSTLIVIGNESQGIKDQIKNLCTQQVTIPKSSSSKVESLNAAMATGIICSEYHRQNQLATKKNKAS